MEPRGLPRRQRCLEPRRLKIGGEALGGGLIEIPTDPYPVRRPFDEGHRVPAVTQLPDQRRCAVAISERSHLNVKPGRRARNGRSSGGSGDERCPGR
jgi:hypothetical protein